MSQGLRTPDADNIALVVVTYYPDSEFVQRILSAASQFKLVILVDNSESFQACLEELDSMNFEVIHNGKNVGLGNALNTGCKRAMGCGFEWAVTLDQDTELNPKFLIGMLEAWGGTPPSTVLLGSNYFNVARDTFKIPVSVSALTFLRTTVITSGCLMHLPTWLSIGMFRGDYFIDSIDHEICLRARQAGFTVAINSQAGMKHTIGDKLRYKTPMARLVPYRHSIWRKYTGARNSLRTAIDYACREPVWSAKTVIGIIFQFCAIIFLEPNKLLRVYAFSVGLLHGCRGKLGPIPARILNLEE